MLKATFTTLSLALCAIATYLVAFNYSNIIKTNPYSAEAANVSTPDEVNYRRSHCIGNLGGIKVAVPNSYIFGPSCVFKGVDIWKKETLANNPKAVSFNNSLDYFTIVIKIADFRPAQDDGEKRSFTKFMGTSPEGRNVSEDWISATFRRTDFTNLQHAFINMSQGEYSGHFEFSGDDFGLKHYIIPGDPYGSKSVEEVNEVWFDQNRGDNLIYCANFRKKYSPYDAMSNCHHLFIIEPNILVKIDGIDRKFIYLSQWTKAALAVKAIFLELVVQ